MTQKGEMRPNSMPGRPDRFVNLDRARAQAIDAQRKQSAEDRAKELLATPYLDRPPHIIFGETPCPTCNATGGNALTGPCAHCGGHGVLGRG